MRNNEENPMKMTTLCYIEKDGKYLMLHRTNCFACDEVSRRREEHVGRDRRADDEIDLFGVHVFLFEQIPYRFDAHVRGAERFAFEDMAGFDADACHDPLVGGIHHTAQFVVGKDVIREVSADACDCSSDFSHL